MKKHMTLYRLVTVLMALILSMGSLGLSSAAPSTLETDRLFFCNFTNQPSQGSVADWWANAAPEGVDCIDLSITNSPETCSLTATFTSYVYASVNDQPFTYTDRLSWYETDAAGVVIRAYEGAPPTTWGSTAYGTGSFTVSFPEDHNGGTTWVLINFNSPESDIGVGLSDYDKDHWRTTSPGVLYEINTDCYQDPPPVVQWCSPGYFKNNTTQWDASLQQMNYLDATGQTLTVKKKGVDVPYNGEDQSLLFVISNPALFGDQSNIAADYVSSVLLGEDYTGRPTATDTYDCPLPGDGN